MGTRYDEFLVRHRLPRPLSMAYEAVCFALNENDVIQRSKWCANVAVRFIGALRQACCLARGENETIGPPSYYDYRRKCEGNFFPEELEEGVPHELLQIAGIYRGSISGKIRETILKTLVKIKFLARYRLIIVDEKGFNVLLGPRIEYSVHHNHTNDFLSRVNIGTPMLVDPQDGRFLTLNPLVIWSKDRTHPFGNLYMLRRMDGLTGRYIEEGMPGFPGIKRPLSGNPTEGILSVQERVLRELESPPARFHDRTNVNNLYSMMGLIWRGGTSDIFMAQRYDNRKLVIFKTYEGESGCFDESYRYYANEERFSRNIDHSNVVKPKKIYLESYGSVYEQDLAQRGSLDDLINSNGVLTAAMSLDITARLLDAVEAVHLAGVVHNDIKPDNILFNNDGSLKLIDFGIASPIESSRRRLRPGVPPGSRGYMAPELTEGFFPSIQSDIFSIGVVLSQMLSGKLVASSEDVKKIKEIPVGFYNFLERCLDPEPELRFSSAREAKRNLEIIQTTAVRAITLDIEGTLIDNFYEKNRRPGLYDFIEFCMEYFNRIFIYTTLNEEESRIVLEYLAEHAYIPEVFLDRYEYILWGRRGDDFYKDLRRCRIPLERNAIVDDSETVIPEDQLNRWIRVPEYNEASRFDRGLFVARNTIMRKFGMEEHDTQTVAE